MILYHSAIVDDILSVVVAIVDDISVDIVDDIGVDIVIKVVIIDDVFIFIDDVFVVLDIITAAVVVVVVATEKQGLTEDSLAHQQRQAIEGRR